MRKHKYLCAYLLVLAVFTSYVIMDTFVISHVYGDASDAGSVTAQLEANDSTEDNDTGDTDTGQAHGPGGKHGDGSGGSPSGGPGKGGKHRHSKSESADSSSSSESSSGSSSSSSGSSSGSSSDTSGTDISAATSKDSYSDDNISIKLNEYTVSGTVVHVAEVKTDSAEYLKTAFAQGSYGKNVTATTSDIAAGVNAILAINGDYYGTQEKGYVIRNGKLYRSTAVSGREDLVIYSDGSFEIINESEVTAEQLIAKGAVQTLSFGPALVENGTVSVDSDDEVGRAMASNPRTAIGIKSDGTYVFVVSDGRTDESEGLSLMQLAEFMKELGVKTAYNLDGGGSSTMVFNGTVVNTPTGGGIGNGSGSERKVSDIVYIGY
jgi:exopolysaccharide biosynthesis protein